MKKYLIVVILTCVCTAAFAQKSKGKTPPPITPEPVPAQQVQPAPGPSISAIFGEHFGRKYGIAQRWGDYDVAKDALYDLITEFPSNDSLIFALAYFYYENQKYTSCALVCNDLLARNARNQAALELSGISYESLNIKDRAFQSYESLYLISNNISTLFKMASLQYDLKRYEESLVNADILLSKPQTDSLKVSFNDAKGVATEHPLKAALLNLKGQSYKAQGDAVKAKKHFEDALKADPTFESAKKNLASLK